MGHCLNDGYVWVVWMTSVLWCVQMFYMCVCICVSGGSGEAWWKLFAVDRSGLRGFMVLDCAVCIWLGVCAPAAEHHHLVFVWPINTLPLDFPVGYKLWSPCHRAVWDVKVLSLTLRFFSAFVVKIPAPGDSSLLSIAISFLFTTCFHPNTVAFRTVSIRFAWFISSISHYWICWGKMKLAQQIPVLILTNWTHYFMSYSLTPLELLNNSISNHCLMFYMVAIS